MPKTSIRATMLRNLQAKIKRIRPMIASKPGRRYLRTYVACKAHISSKRYYIRNKYGPTFRPSTKRPPCYALFYKQSPENFKHDFRLTYTEMDRLIDAYGRCQVFKGSWRKPQARPLYQIGMLVHRLASGNDARAVAKRFGISTGTVHLWTTRACTALLESMGDVIAWPNQDERRLLVQRNFANTHIPHFLGVIDGTHINLDRAPGHGDDSGLFYSYKGRYGFNYVAIVDAYKRFIYLHYGYSARSSDMRVQRVMRPLLEPENFFDDDQYILADAGFACGPHIIPMYKRQAKRVDLPPRKLFFNNTVKAHRVIVEHAFGILKGRWQLLRNGRLRLRTEQDEVRAHAIIQCAFILHNLFIKTAEQYVTEEDLRDLIEEEELYRRWQIEREDAYDAVSHLHQRRERLVDEMLELEDEIEKDLLDIARVRR